LWKKGGFSVFDSLEEGFAPDIRRVSLSGGGDSKSQRAKQAKHGFGLETKEAEIGRKKIQQRACPKIDQENPKGILMGGERFA